MTHPLLAFIARDPLDTLAVFAVLLIVAVIVGIEIGQRRGI